MVLTSSGKFTAFVSRSRKLPVSADVQVPAEMPRSGNEVMSKQHKQIGNISLWLIIQGFYTFSFYKMNRKNDFLV